MVSAPATYLVTGGMGCLGAWTLYHLVQQQKRALSFDLSHDRARLDLLLDAEAQRAITFVPGDLTDSAHVARVVAEHKVTHIIHLAALQVPFCRANPSLGAQVNVTGTVNIFEAARQAGISHLSYASSVAVYGPSDAYPPGVVASGAPLDPRTLYGVYKQANEGTARIYHQDHDVSSTGLRPFTVYGVGRDQGLTSEPTKAILAAAARQPYSISFGGSMQFHLASDVARLFIEAAETPLGGAHVFNLGTQPTQVEAFVETLRTLRPGLQLGCGETVLPFPEGLEAGELSQHFPDAVATPLEQGVKETLEHFERLLTQGRLSLAVG